MQSHNFKPGVSGWKLHKNGAFEFHSSGDPCLASLGKKEQPKPFVVVDGVTYISEAEVERGSITNAKIGDSWSIKMELRDGQYFAAGIGLGVGQCFCSGGYTGGDQKPADQDLVDLIREAASKGASDGYRAVLEDLKKST